jgi:hypothetical protein
MSCWHHEASQTASHQTIYNTNSTSYRLGTTHTTTTLNRHATGARSLEYESAPTYADEPGDDADAATNVDDVQTLSEANEANLSRTMEHVPSSLPFLHGVLTGWSRQSAPQHSHRIVSLRRERRHCGWHHHQFRSFCDGTTRPLTSPSASFPPPPIPPPLPPSPSHPRSCVLSRGGGGGGGGGGGAGGPPGGGGAGV